MVRAAILGELKRRGKTRHWLARTATGVSFSTAARFLYTGKNPTLSTAEAFLTVLEMAIVARRDVKRKR